jgi:hypothetical protein
MSYGVVASKAAELRVEHLDRPDTGTWGKGRLTLTSLHLSFVPTRSAAGAPALTIDLGDVLSVDTTTRRGHRTVHVRTPTVVLHARVTGATAFARRVTTSVEATRRRAVAEPVVEPAEQTADGTLSPER